MMAENRSTVIQNIPIHDFALGECLFYSTLFVFLDTLDSHAVGGGAISLNAINGAIILSEFAFDAPF